MNIRQRSDPVKVGLEGCASAKSSPLMKQRSASGHAFGRIAGAALATALLLTAPITEAKTSAESGEQWSEWKALSGGFVGRRREPPKADLPRQSRRLATTQARGSGRLYDNSVSGQAGGASRLRTALAAPGSASLRKIAPSSKDGGGGLEAVWLRTRAAGLYGASVAELATQLGERTRGLRKKAAGGELSLTNAGQAVSWYFDEASDKILFPAEAYDTFHTDVNASRFWVDTSAAQPMQVAAGPPTGAMGVDAPFTDTLIFEEEPDFGYSTWTVALEPDADYWFWDHLYGGYKDSMEVDLTVPNPALAGAAQLRVTMRGWTDIMPGDEHQVYAELNGTPVGSAITWDGFEEAVLVADFDQSLLNTSGSNTLTLRNVYAAGTHPGQWLDQVEINYLRQPVAANGALRLRGAQAGVQTVTSFADNDILVIEAPAGAAVMREDARVDPDGSGGWMVTFETSGGADYLITERGAVDAPVLVPDYPSSLSDGSNSADYLILAPREFTGTAEALATLRQSQFSHVRIAWLDEIYDEFNDGRADPAAIGRFMDRVASAWQMSPSNVTLIGKGSLDCKDRMGYGDCFLPILMTSNPWALAASDERLLAGEGDAPFAVGRLPITNDAEGIAYVNKLTVYETTTYGDERFQAVLAADNPDIAGDFHVNSDQMAERLLDSLGFATVGKLYHSQDAVRTELIDSSTWEIGYVAYDGHGSATQVGSGSENFLKVEDAAALANASRPVFAALTCAVGDDTYPGVRSLAAALVLNPAGGAIASMAPSGLSLDADAQQLGIAFVDSLYGDHNTIGGAVREAKAQTVGSIAAFMPRMYSVVGEPAVRAR